MRESKTAYKLEEPREFLIAAEKKGAVISDLTADELSSMLLTVCNGLVSTWISYKGSYLLVQESERIIPVVVRTFIRIPLEQLH